MLLHAARYIEFEGDSRCGGDDTQTCADRMGYHNQPNAECCALAQYITDSRCCAFQSDPIGPGYNCCSTATFSGSLECKCSGQVDALTPNDCCDYSAFAHSFECTCASQQNAIDYTTSPPFNCCNQTRFANDPNCLCPAQIASTGNYLTPQHCCDLSQYANQHECICSTQSSPFTPVACCDSNTFKTSPQCICEAQQNTSLLTPYNCCTLTDYMSELECQCQLQTSPISPKDCCSTAKFQDNPLCACQDDSNFDVDSCCLLYPNKPQCQCQRHFEIPACCVYDSTHEGCNTVPTGCSQDDTYQIIIEDINNYYYNNNTITIIEGLIFLNALTSSNHQTIQAIGGNNPVTVNTGSLTSNGLSASASGNTVYAAELPWKGTFSVNVWFDRDVCDENIELTIYSCTHFAVVAVVNQGAATVQYKVKDATNNVVITIDVDVQSPNTTWWTQLTGDDRDNFFESFIPHKVELGFSGRDCWLTVVSVNNQVVESGVWGCLVPDSEVVTNIGTNNDIEIRDHFGTFNLGYNSLTKSTNPQGAVTISYVYLVAGVVETLGVCAPQIVAAPYNNLTQIDADDQVTCRVAFDWSRVSLLPNGSNCEAVGPNCQYGYFQTIQYSHSLLYVPLYQECGTVTPIADDVAVKTHICSECGALISGTPTCTGDGNKTSIGLLDLVVLAASFEEYNPTVDFVSNSSINLYLVADYQAGVRSVMTPTLPSSGLSSIAQLNLSFTFSVVSFPSEALNGDNEDPAAEVVLNIRLFGQETISIVLLVKAEGNIILSLT